MRRISRLAGAQLNKPTPPGRPTGSRHNDDGDDDETPMIMTTYSWRRGPVVNALSIAEYYWPTGGGGDGVVVMSGRPAV